MFTEILRSALARVEGAQACALVGFDGLPVEVARAQAADLPIDISLLTARLAMQLSESRRLADELGQGGLRSFELRSKRSILLAHVVDEHYFVCLVLAAGALAGKGRFVLRSLEPRLRLQL